MYGGYNQYDPNSQSPFPDPGTVLPAGQTIDVIYAQPYSQQQQQSAGTGYYNQNQYGQNQSQDYYSSSQSMPHQYDSESSQRFQINPSYADAVHLDGVSPTSSYNNTPSYGSNELYNSAEQYSTQQYPPGATTDSYPPTSQYNDPTQSSYQSQYYPSQSSFSDSAYSSTIQQPAQSQPTQWTPTQSAANVQWHLPHTDSTSAGTFYPAPGAPNSPSIPHLSTQSNTNLPTQSNTNLPTYQSNTNLPAYQSNTNLPAYQSNTNLPAYQSNTNPPYQSNTNLPAYPSNTNLPYNSSNPPVKQQSPQTANPSYAGSPSQNRPQGSSPVSGNSSVQSPPVSSAQNKLQQLALTEERQKMEKERAELLKQQELMRQRQDELKKQEEAMKVLHAQEEQKLHAEIEKQRDEVAKMKAELAKQSSEQQLQQAQKAKVIEVQKGEMQRQMDELMKERELVKKHEEEMRNAILEEQRLMLQQLKQQQHELSQQQQAVYDHARQAEHQRQLEHQHKLEAQRRQEEELLKAKQAIDQQQQALQRQMQEAKESARKMEEAQRAAAEQQQKAAAQQKQTEEQRRLAEEKRKQVEEQYQKTLWEQKQQQDAFAKQEGELRKRQEQLNAEQERVRNVNRDAESKIEADKRQMNERIQAQQRALQQQQEEIKRQQELVTLQQKELLVKKKEQQEAVEKEKASASVKDLLAPMRNSANGWQPKSPTSPPGPTQIGTHTPPQPQPPPKPSSSKAPAKPFSPPPPKPQSPAKQPPKLGRADSRMLPNLNLNERVEGYLLGDVVRAQRYVRRWLMRRRFVKLVQQYRASDDKTAEKLRHRNKALHEIYTSELSYVASLQLLSNFYVVPMQVESMVKHTFTEKDAQIIFSSANTLLDVSKGLVAELEARLDKWPSVQLFGDIFVRLAPVMKLYAEYINNFDAAMVRLKALLGTPEGLSFFENCKAKSRSQLDINSLLIMPVQRVPRYELLLRELIKFTEESHVDFANLNAAFKAIHQVNTYINQKKKDVDSRQKLTAIQNGVKGCPNLVLAHRYYVFEGNLQVSSTDKNKSGMFYFFLFNDMLMACKKAGGLFHRHEYEYVFSIDLREAIVKRVAENVMFRVMSGGLEDINVAIYTFLCQNQTEKESWMKQFVGIEEDETGSKKLLVRDASQGTVQR